jgi:hypothetical protein
VEKLWMQRAFPVDRRTAKFILNRLRRIFTSIGCEERFRPALRLIAPVQSVEFVAFPE